MQKNNKENLQYNSCISRGICSVNPRTGALQNVLGVYMQLCAEYCLKILEKDVLKSEIKNFILNTVATTVFNSEFTENCFMELISQLKMILPEIIETYNELYGKTDFKGEDILNSDIFKRSENIVDAIQLGEAIFRKTSECISSEQRDIFKLILLISKSISINILDIESYGYSCKDALKEILKLLSVLNKKELEVPTLKSIVVKGVECNIRLIKRLHEVEELRYGRQGKSEVSYTTTPSKAVLVVGSNIRELETVLEILKDKNIDVYTHDEMMVAHTFPKFKEYKHLKGQYGHGVENCLIDFATFPGPIILTKHSLHNIENFYRGRLFTTDNNSYKGIIKIKDNDYSEVISSAKSAKGFKRGKLCETVVIGYNYEEILQEIYSKLNTKKYRKVLLIGLKEYSGEKDVYYKNLIKLIPDDFLIVSFSYDSERDNFVHLNTCFDSYSIIRIYDAIIQYNLPVDVCMPKCDSNTITKIIYLAEQKNTNVFVGECEPIIINPTLKNILKDIFNIKSITTAKKDITEL